MIEINNVRIEINSLEDVTLREELINNATVILTTLRGTNPQDRAMGLRSGEILGRSVVVAKAAYSVQAIEQLEKYEPRLAVIEISFEAGYSKLIPKVVLSYNVN